MKEIDEQQQQQTKPNEGCVLATKVAPPVYILFHMLANAQGTTTYKLQQMCIETLVRYMSREHNMTVEMEKAMAIFEYMDGWADALSLAEPSAKKEICEATYYFSDPTGKRKGKVAIHIRMPYFGDWQQSENIVTIFNRTLENLFPVRYRRLRQLAEDLQCGNILELLDTLIDTHTKEAELDELRQPFQDANRADGGRPIEYGNKPVRKMHYTPDTKQPTFNFHDEPEP